MEIQFYFDLKYLKELVYYGNSLSFQIYRTIVDYWYENDRDYLEKLANKNRTAREVIDRYYYEEYNGRVRRILEFWKIEKELYNAIARYSGRKVLMKIIHDVEKKCLIRYSKSEKDALAKYLTDKAPEMVGRKENHLLNNSHFLGFFIPGKIEKKTLKILGEKYSGKILFDGKRIKVIGK